MSNDRWIAGLPNKSKLLCQIVIPGSHDAGVYRDTSNIGPNSLGYALQHGLATESKLTGLATKQSGVICQSKTIFDQAMAGSRFFDCRVFLRKFPIKKIVDGKKQSSQKVPTMGHFFQDKPGLAGGFGGSLLTVINDALNFVKTHTSEFIILRFSHTKCVNEVSDALEYIYDQPGNAAHIFTGDVNISTQPISALQGKVILIFDSKFNKQRLKSTETYQKKGWFGTSTVRGVRGLSAKGMHLFSKSNGKTPSPNGIACCGDYSMDLMSSQDSKMKIRLDQQINAAHKHHDHNKDHLCFIYWQVTGGDIEANTKRQGGPHEKLTGFLLDLVRDASGNALQLPNVISHDFVDEMTCSRIIRMNTELKQMMSEVIARDVVGRA